jgi:hypothetical protein
LIVGPPGASATCCVSKVAASQSPFTPPVPMGLQMVMEAILRSPSGSAARGVAFAGQRAHMARPVKTIAAVRA